MACGLAMPGRCSATMTRASAALRASAGRRSRCSHVVQGERGDSAARGARCFTNAGVVLVPRGVVASLTACVTDASAGAPPGRARRRSGLRRRTRPENPPRRATRTSTPAGSRWKTAPVSSSRPVCAACFAHAFASRGGGSRATMSSRGSTEPWVLTMTSRGLSAAGRRADRSARRRRATIRRMRVLPSGVLRFSRGSPVRRRAARCGGRGARRRRRCRVAGGVRAAPRR